MRASQTTEQDNVVKFPKTIMTECMPYYLPEQLENQQNVIPLGLFYDRSREALCQQNALLAAQRKYWFSLYETKAVNHGILDQILFLEEILNHPAFDVTGNEAEKLLEEKFKLASFGSYPDALIRLDQLSWTLQRLNHYILYYRRVRKNIKYLNDIPIQWQRPVMKELYALRKILIENINETLQEIHQSYCSAPMKNLWEVFKRNVKMILLSLAFNPLLEI